MTSTPPRASWPGATSPRPAWPTGSACTTPTSPPPPDFGPYDLVTAFECLHDLPHPVPALAAMRRLAGRVGTVLIADMKAARQFPAPGDDLERLLYRFSLLICLPDSMSSPGSAATGTVLRPGTVRDYAIQVGYTRIDTLPVDHDL